MKKLLTFLIWTGIIVSALFAITSAISNVLLIFSAFPESIGDKYAYIFILGRWTFTIVMGLIFWLLYRQTKK
ncbi:hypothetical protein [Enterobacter bugandensis]|uniref:hypothetical protein n=1 Tax=Enterobacter bugandensis TaxID=881260 RepID=UPI001D0CABA2|nr:hypothetical protein [Enterobacter bugandensis]MCC2001293.1 hypothetical protein [Enterobacter bugandensis]MDH2699608.1 hypothetical protein [Enterobacter bugandensis]